MRKSNIVLFIIGFLTGVLIGIILLFCFQKWGFFIFERRINIGSVAVNFLSLFGTLLIAVYVTRILSRRNELEKKERDLLINYLDNFEAYTIDVISEMISSNLFYTQKSKENFKIIRFKLDCLIKSFKSKDFSHNELKNRIKKLWDLFTGDKKENKEDLVKIELIKFQHQIYKMSIEINKQ